MVRKVTLRDVQKADTRLRLLDAASRVFFRDGYDATTIDQIANEANASRPTFYAHFRDKEHVLAELMDQYWDRAIPFLQRLPTPNPSIDELKIWLGDIGLFLKQERPLFSLLNQVVGHSPPNSPNYGIDTVKRWIAALAPRSAAFAAAARGKKSDIPARARAELLIVEIVWAACNVLVEGDKSFTEETVALVATSLHEFINDSRYQAVKSKRK